MTNTGQTFVGISLDINSSNISVLEASDHLIANPDSRWLQSGAKTFGDLVDDRFGLALPGIGGTGLSTSGLTDFVLFSEIQFSATGEGLTNLSFDYGAQGIGDSSGSSVNDVVFGTGSVSVSAVPEPGSLAVLALSVTALIFVRNRRTNSCCL